MYLSTLEAKSELPQWQAISSRVCEPGSELYTLRPNRD